MLTWSHQQGEDVRDACSASCICLFLETPVLEQCIELFGNLRGTIYFHGNHFCALIQELGNEIWQGCYSWPHEKRNNGGLSCFSFFFGRKFGSNWPKKSKKMSKCTPEYLLKQKIKKRPMLRFFVWPWRTTLPKFRFPTLHSGCKSLKPKCPGSSWNQLVGCLGYWVSNASEWVSFALLVSRPDLGPSFF